MTSQSFSFLSPTGETTSYFKAWMWKNDQYLVGVGKSNYEAIRNCLCQLANSIIMLDNKYDEYYSQQNNQQSNEQ